MAALNQLTLEDIFAGQGFADVNASPLQIAICRTVHGRPLEGVLTPDELERHFGVAEIPPGHIPRIVALICGVRGGKSWIASCAMIHAALTADLSMLKIHELPRAAIIGPTTDAAEATFRILVGILQSSPVLRKFIEGEPTSDTVIIKRPDGRRVEICVVAAAKGGVTVRNRWLVGFVIEEVAQIGAEATGAAISAEEILRAAETRLLKGCQGWLISSPFGPVGLLYETYKRHFGKLSKTLVVHAPTRAMNPSFPQESIDAIAAEDPDTAAREYGAEWVDAESAFLPAAIVVPAIRETPLIRPRPSRARCVAAMDPAARGNAWTLAVAFLQDSRLVIAGAWQWIGSKQAPLSPSKTFGEIADILRPFGSPTIRTDGWSFDSLDDIARSHGLRLLEVSPSERDAAYGRLKAGLGNGAIELPPNPEVRSDLLSVRSRATSGGSKIVLPKQANGRHCDFAPSIALVAGTELGTRSRKREAYEKLAKKWRAENGPDQIMSTLYGYPMVHTVN